MPVNIERESEESEDHSVLVDETKTLLLKERPKRISFSKLSPVVTPEDTKGEFPIEKIVSLNLCKGLTSNCHFYLFELDKATRWISDQN